MTGPIIPADQWPEGAVALVWSAVGLGKWVTADSFTGAWEVDLADVPMPDGWDWRVPVMRPTCKDSLPVAPAIDLEQFRGAFVVLIDGQKAAPRGPDQPDLCDLCRVREEVRTDAEGIPFCQECWDGWQASDGEGAGHD